MLLITPRIHQFTTTYFLPKETGQRQSLKKSESYISDRCRHFTNWKIRFQNQQTSVGYQNEMNNY